MLHFESMGALKVEPGSVSFETATCNKKSSAA